MAGDRPASDGTRRRLLRRATGAAMLGGLAAGYGYCGSIAVRYAYPPEAERVRLFVAPVASVRLGGSLDYQLPNGARVTITRHADSGRADDFIALSSRCPHLGCKVHWQSAERRYFCPCHNGSFDVQGAPTSGPPKADNTPLSRYPLVMERGLLYIELSKEELA